MEKTVQQKQKQHKEKKAFRSIGCIQLIGIIQE